MKKTIYSTDEAAARLGLETETVNKYIHRGLIRAEKAGRYWVITVNELDAFKQRHKFRESQHPAGE